MRNAGRSACFLSAVAVAVSTVVAWTASAEAPDGPVLPRRGPIVLYVRAPAAIAVAKLSNPECRLVLSDFRDTGGRLLNENLGSLGVTAPEYFKSLRFVDGSDVDLCRRPLVAAGANPGVPVVAVCAYRFGEVFRKDPHFAANLLIHEMLHALGLSEAPLVPDAPTSGEITQQVARRCGR